MSYFHERAVPAATTHTSVFTTSSLEEAVISSIKIINRSTTDTAYASVYIYETVGGRGTNDVEVGDVYLAVTSPSNGHFYSEVSGITVPPGYTVSVYASTGDVVFNFNGEVSSVGS